MSEEKEEVEEPCLWMDSRVKKSEEWKDRVLGLLEECEAHENMALGYRPTGVIVSIEEKIEEFEEMQEKFNQARKNEKSN